jgi:hypothetical protein
LVVPGSTEGIPPLGALCFRELNEVEKNEFSLESATAIGQLQIQLCGSSTRRMDGLLEDLNGLKLNIFALIDDKLYLLKSASKGEEPHGSQSNRSNLITKKPITPSIQLEGTYTPQLVL